MYKKFFSAKKMFGFTLTELMVTISVVSIISVVVIYNYSTFNEKLSVSAAIQQMSVDIRQAQVYGLSVKESSSGGGDFNRGYGIYISTTDTSNYYIFVDKNSNGKYDGSTDCSASAECIEKVTFKNGVKVASICGAAFGGALTCPPDATVRGVNITFVRPNTDAVIRFTTSTGVFFGGTFQTARINFASPKNSVGRVVIENTGQIYAI